MIDEALQEKVAGYLLGELSPAEATAFESRLAGDASLRAYLRERQVEVERLTLEIAPQAEPPPAVRDRLLAAAAADPRVMPAPSPAPVRARPERTRTAGARFGWPDFWWRALAGAVPLTLLLACGGLWWLRETTQRDNRALRERERELVRENETLRAATGELTTLRSQRDRAEQEATALRTQAANAARETAGLRQLLDQASREALAAREQAVFPRLQVGLLHGVPNSLTATPAPSPLPVAAAAAVTGGIAIWDAQKQEGMLVVENLPVPRPDQDYQVWVGDPALPQPVPSGVFHPARPGGRQTMRFVTRERINRAVQFMVTLERKGGVNRIQGPAVLESARQ